MSLVSGEPSLDALLMSLAWSIVYTSDALTGPWNQHFDPPVVAMFIEDTSDYSVDLEHFSRAVDVSEGSLLLSKTSLTPLRAA